MVYSPLSAYACLLSYIPTGHLEFRSDKDTSHGVGIQPLHPPHNGKKLPSQNNNGIPDAPETGHKKKKYK